MRAMRGKSQSKNARTAPSFPRNSTGLRAAAGDRGASVPAVSRGIPPGLLTAACGPGSYATGQLGWQLPQGNCADTSVADGPSPRLCAVCLGFHR